MLSGLKHLISTRCVLLGPLSALDSFALVPLYDANRSSNRGKIYQGIHIMTKDTATWFRDRTYDYTSAKEISYKVVNNCYLICAQKHTFHFLASKGCNEHPTYKKSFF